MAKCGDCGRLIDPRRGYCTFFKCHHKSVGTVSLEKPKGGRTVEHGGHKRCPFCRGDRNGKGPCFISSCDRGPNGKSCGCHYQIAGMGNPGQEMHAVMAQAGLVRRHADGGAQLNVRAL